MKFVELSEEEYSLFQANHPYNNFLNSLDTYHLEQKENVNCVLVGMKENDKVVCAAFLMKLRMMKKFYFYYAPRGILIDYNNTALLKRFTKELKKYMKSKRAIQFIMDPYILYKERDSEGKIVENGFNHSQILKNIVNAGYIHKGFSTGYDDNMQTIRWMYSMSLENETEQSLWKKLDQQTRWSINRTIRYNMQIKECTTEDLDLYEDIMNKTGQRRQFETRPKSFYQNQMEAYGNKMKLLLAYVDTPLLLSSLHAELQNALKEKEEVESKLQDMPNSKKFNKKLKVVKEAIDIANKKIKEAKKLEEEHGTFIPMAASLFIFDRDEVIYLTSGAYEEFRDFYASYAIQWYIIKEAMKLGYKKYNFYGISGIFDPKDESYGVYAFKKGFPGQVEELLGDFVLVINRPLYRLYHKLSKSSRRK